MRKWGSSYIELAMIVVSGMPKKVFAAFLRRVHQLHIISWMLSLNVVYQTPTNLRLIVTAIHPDSTATLLTGEVGDAEAVTVETLGGFVTCWVSI
jgi:hypothetical protein